jgi:hypothetical protein
LTFLDLAFSTRAATFSEPGSSKSELPIYNDASGEMEGLFEMRTYLYVIEGLLEGESHATGDNERVDLFSR